MRRGTRRLILGSFLAGLAAWGLGPGGFARAAAPAPLSCIEGMVVSESPEASRIGAEVLSRGGNAVDAAVAVHFALAVAYPQAGNLGGGGFMLVRMADGTAEAIDFREVAPAAATRDIFLRADGTPDTELSTVTHLASAVPGSVAGMGLAHERFGTRPWNELLAPAQRIASEGLVLDGYTAGHLIASRGRLEGDPETRRILLRDGQLWSEGDTLPQPELAATIGRIARLGPREFYEGATAESLVAEMERGGGLVTREDLRAYRPVVRRPLEGSYRGCRLLTMPPPSSGGVALLQALGLLEGYDLRESGPLSSRALHLLAEAMKRAFADRAEFMGDPDFSPLPVDGLLAAAYLDSLRARIDPGRATPGAEAGPGLPRGAGEFYAATGGRPGVELALPGNASPGGFETTHFSVVDREGNVVAVTTTLNSSYGSGLMVRGAGFLLNNEMDDFAAAPGRPNQFGLIQGEANAVRPFARPLSSMVPTIVVRDGSPLLVLGSPGGPRIISAVLQAIVAVLDFGMDAQAAVASPRIHHQWWPDLLYHERDALAADTRLALEARGHRLAAFDGIGSVQAIEIRTGDGGARRLLGGSDPRRNGCAAGVSGGRVVSRCSCAPCLEEP